MITTSREAILADAVCDMSLPWKHTNDGRIVATPKGFTFIVFRNPDNPGWWRMYCKFACGMAVNDGNFLTSRAAQKVALRIYRQEIYDLQRGR